MLEIPSVCIVDVGCCQMPIKWLALESIQHRIYTHKSDVWSYGMMSLCMSVCLSVCLCLSVSMPACLSGHSNDTVQCGDAHVEIFFVKIGSSVSSVGLFLKKHYVKKLVTKCRKVIFYPCGEKLAVIRLHPNLKISNKVIANV